MYNWVLVAILTQVPSGADPDIISRHITRDACRKQMIYHQERDPNRKYLCLPRDTN
jgi:hypothetical protein